LLVNHQDVVNWNIFNHLTGEQNSSWYDFNFDGVTDEVDLNNYIIPNLGKNCRQPR
jgi:hypothetical protein